MCEWVVRIAFQNSKRPCYMPFYVLAAPLRGAGPRRRASAAILAGCNARRCTRGAFTRTSERCAPSRAGIGGGVRGTCVRSRHVAMSVAHVHQNGHADGRGLGVDCFFTLHACVSSATAGCPAVGSHVHQECPLWRRVLPHGGGDGAILRSSEFPKPFFALKLTHPFSGYLKRGRPLRQKLVVSERARIGHSVRAQGVGAS